MMKKVAERQELVSALADFCHIWRGGKPSISSDGISESVTLSTSYQGVYCGKDEVINALQQSFKGVDLVRLETSNCVTRADREQAVLSAYVHGVVRKDNRSSLFGALILLHFSMSDKVPDLCDARIQISWVKDERSFPDGWYLPTGQPWQRGDRPAVILSEMDSPWHLIPDSLLHLSDEEAIEEAWYRYAWALDQADFSLLADSFSSDASGNFVPIGHLNGRREIVSAIKAFRLPWPWMQHYGQPLAVKVSSDGQSASAYVGRIIPENTHTDDGEPIWGAHYRICMARSSIGNWLIGSSEYCPGWLTMATLSVPEA